MKNINYKIFKKVCGKMPFVEIIWNQAVRNLYRYLNKFGYNAHII